MKNILLFNICLLLFLSCNSRHSCNTCNSHTEYTWNLENGVLHRAILEYIDSVPLEDEGLLSLTYFHIDDSTIKYRISYITNSFELGYKSPLLFFYVNEHLVSFAIDNFNYTSYGSEFISLSHVSLIDIMKSKFPKQNKDFFKSGNLSFSIKREIPIVMELTYQHRELIEKKLGQPEWMWYESLDEKRLGYMGFMPIGIPNGFTCWCGRSVPCKKHNAQLIEERKANNLFRRIFRKNN